MKDDEDYSDTSDEDDLFALCTKQVEIPQIATPLEPVLEQMKQIIHNSARAALAARIQRTEIEEKLENRFAAQFSDIIKSHKEEEKRVADEIFGRLSLQPSERQTLISNVNFDAIEHQVLQQEVYTRRRKIAKAHREKQIPETFNQTALSCQQIDEHWKILFEKAGVKPADEKTAFNTSFGTSESSKDTIKMQASKEKREWILKEILSTEKTYIESLKILEDWFMNSLKDSTLMEFTSWDIVFKFVGLIQSVNEPLLEDLESFMRERHTPTSQVNKTNTVPHIFHKHMQQFRQYSNYINNYPLALQHLQICRTKNPEFKKWEEQLSKEMFQRQFRINTIQSYLILPVQRIPRYSLLLDDLLKETPEQHPEHSLLYTACKEIKKIAVYCNEQKSESESRMKVSEIQEKLKLKDLANSTRLLVREGSINLSNKSVYLYLLTDLLIITDKKKVVTVDLTDPIVSISVPSDTEESKSSTCFFMELSRIQYAFTCASISERDGWIRDIGKRILFYNPVISTGNHNELGTISSESIIKEGWLIKSGEKENSFMKKRYHVLMNSKIKYYDRPHGKLKGSYLLHNSRVRINEVGNDKQNFDFDIITPSRTYHLRAETDEIRRSWIQSIEMCNVVTQE